MIRHFLRPTTFNDARKRIIERRIRMKEADTDEMFADVAELNGDFEAANDLRESAERGRREARGL